MYGNEYESKVSDSLIYWERRFTHSSWLLHDYFEPHHGMSLMSFTVEFRREGFAPADATRPESRGESGLVACLPVKDSRM